MKNDIYRQGDVLLRQITEKPRAGQDASERGRIVLAHGEVTGHAHEIIDAHDVANVDVAAAPPAQFFQEPDGRRFLFVERVCLLVHQEHGPITIPPGCYEVVRQREYTPEAIRQVAD